MLEAGAPVPDVQVWADIREESKPLKELLGASVAGAKRAALLTRRAP